MSSEFHFVFDRVIASPVETKTADGKSYREIEKTLLEKLPASCHDIRELGYSSELKCKTYYGFVPWHRLRERLREIVGSSGWRFEIVSSHLNGQGDPIMVGILNVLGVEHQGIGYGRSHGGYKGGKDEIAWADCFKNAAEQHGLGAYLDDQEGLVRYLLQSKSEEAIAKGRMLAIQFQKAGRMTLDELRGWDKSNNKPATKPTKAVKQDTQPSIELIPVATKPPKEYLYPQHNSQMRELRQVLGLPSEYILMKSNDVYPGDMSVEAFQQMVIEIVSEWAFRQEKFNSVAIAKAALEGAIQQMRGEQIPFIKSIHNWIDSVHKGLTPIA